jgi:transcriptional regulator with XRE-family HTH domain
MATDPELVERARTLRSAGLSIEQIATRLDLRSRSMVYRWVRDLPPPQWTARPNAKDDLREQARAMRADGALYREITAALHVSASSVSLWVRDMPWPQRSIERKLAAKAAMRAGHRRYYKERALAEGRARDAAVAAVRDATGACSDRDLLVAGATAYWAEGSKNKEWRVADQVTFINSDVDMIRLFLAFLRHLGVGEQQLRFRVSIHESADEAAARDFWAEVVGHPADTFQRSTLKRHNPVTVRKNVGVGYHGCLVINVLRSKHLYRQIEGIWRAISGPGPRLGPPSRIV